MCQYLEDVCNSVNQHFPNGQCMILQNYAWEKDPFRMQDIPVCVCMIKRLLQRYNLYPIKLTKFNCII